MDKNKIKWCLKQRKGIRLIELKQHLSESYIKEADETLENVLNAKGKWKIIMAYYACYDAFYAILMRCGIKSEIHDCSLGLMALFDFDENDKDFIKKLKEDRIKSQYYLKDIIFGDERKIKEFILKCKNILNDLNSEKIDEIRKEIGELD